MYLRGWPLYYAKEVDLCNELDVAVNECISYCVDDDKKLILVSSALCQYAYDLGKEMENEKKKS